jgi:hypothetical protein
MVNLPLYNSLIKDVENIVPNNEKFLKLIKDFDTSGYELVYALIRAHQYNTTKDIDDVEIIPYGGKYIKNEMKFDLNDLPEDLQKILYKFSVMHTQTMKEENIIKKNRGK